MRGFLYLGFFICLVTGIVAGRYLRLPVLVLVLGFVVVLAACLAVVYRSCVKILVLAAAFIILGAALMYRTSSGIKAGVLPRLAVRKAAVEVEGRIVSPSVASGEGSAFFVDVSVLNSPGVEYKIRERLLLRVDSPAGEEKYFPGERVWAHGSLSAPTANHEWLFDHGAACTLNAGAARLKIVKGSADPISKLICRLRIWMSKRCRRIYPQRVAGFIEGVTMSKQDNIDSVTLSELRSCGLGHVIAVSGLHVGSAAMLALALMTALGTGRRSRYIVAFIMALFVLAISNFRLSALRAFIMAGACFACVLAGREYDPLVGLDIAGILMLCVNPCAIFDATFQFSFAAAVGIVLAVGKQGKEGRKGGLSTFLAVSAGAQLSIAPLMLLKGEAVPVTAVAANLIAVPLIGFFIVAGWGSAVVSSVNLSLGRAIATPVSMAARFILAMASTLSKVPLSGLVGGMVSAVALLLYMLALIGFIKWARGGASIFKPVIATVTAVLLMLVPCMPVAGFSSANRITILDVGEGDATLIQDVTGTAVLVDGGPDGEKLLEKLRARGVQKLDAIVLSHPHSDHIKGFLEVIRNMPVGRLIDPAIPTNSPVYRELLRLAGEKRVTRTCVREGQVLDVSRWTELDIIYAPVEGSVVASDINESCMVIMVRLAGMRALMTGDMGIDEQEKLISFHPNISCDVLKVPHHGAREAALDELYSACAPAVAAISVGKENKFGHPSSRCLKLLLDRRIHLERTDRDGDVEISVDNGKIGVVTSRR